MEGGESALFVRQFYGSVSTYLWQDDEDTVHDVQHQAFVAVHDQLIP